MKALILAGGLGTRLRSLVSDRPKAMATVGDKPFLAHQLNFLKAQGITDIVLCVGYLHELVEEYFGNGRQWGVNLTYSVESAPLGTGGALKLAQRFVDGTFLVLNGDSFFDVDLTALIAYHQQQRAVRGNGHNGNGNGNGAKGGNGRCLGTLALATVPDASRYGAVELDKNQHIIKFAEKSAQQAPGDAQINAGVYVLEQDVLEMMPSDTKISIEREVFPAIMQSNSHLCGYVSAGFFVDIGTPTGYYQYLEYMGMPQ